MIFTSLAGFLARMIGNRRKPLIIGGTSLTLGTLVFSSGYWRILPTQRRR